MGLPGVSGAPVPIVAHHPGDSIPAGGQDQYFCLYLFAFILGRSCKLVAHSSILHWIEQLPGLLPVTIFPLVKLFSLEKVSEWICILLSQDQRLAQL